MKIGNPFRRISVRYRYLFSFLLMALIPIGMILLFFYHYNINELKKDVDDINLSRVAQIQSSIESELMKHYSLAGALNRDPVFLPLARRGTPVSNYEAMLVLSQYMSYRSPVSYTHLDVYKRQPSRISVPLPGFWAATGPEATGFRILLTFSGATISGGS